MMNLTKKHFAVFAMLMVCVMAFSSTASASEGGSTWDQIKDAASDVKDAVTEAAPGIIEDAKETGGKLVDAAKEKGSEALETAKEELKETQETVTDLRQQQEDQFWSWFSNQIHRNQSTAASGDSGDQSETTTPDSQIESETTPEEASHDGEPASTDESLTVPPVYYYDPNAVVTVAVDADGNPITGADGMSATVQDYPEEGSTGSSTTSAPQLSSTETSNELPQITPQPEQTKQLGHILSNLSEQVAAWAPTAIMVVVGVALLLAGIVVYRRVDRL